MDLHQLEESDVLSISLEQAHRYFELLLLANGGNRYALSAWNKDGAPLEMSFGALRLQANLTNADNAGVLGELESISHVDGTLVLEGDFGDITVKADTVSVKKL